ncbi:MAG: cupin domain-containing protein [Planctomycetales bacterium]|nr:cupin domain-containing protein [Planctomycetales bacterium]
MTPPRPPVSRTAATGAAVSIVGDVYRFLATGEETDGKYSTWEAIVPPGGGPPPHIHRREEESFIVLEGEVTFWADGRRFTVGPGGFVGLPVGSLHCFKNESNQPARMIISVAPAGLERMFFEVGTPLPSGATEALPPSPEEIEKLMRIAPNYGVEIHPPSG